MISPISKLKITISKTSDGKSDYVQIIHEDQFSVNVVLIAAEIEVSDTRPKKGKS